MAAVPSVPFPFKGSDNAGYSGQTLPLDAAGNVVVADAAGTAAIVATGPGTDGFAVTPSDTVNFTTNARSLYVGVAGDVAVVTPAGTVLLHKNVPAGAILPISAKRVSATNTTASSILGYL